MILDRAWALSLEADFSCFFSWGFWGLAGLIQARSEEGPGLEATLVHTGTFSYSPQLPSGSVGDAKSRVGSGVIAPSTILIHVFLPLPGVPTECERSLHTERWGKAGASFLPIWPQTDFIPMWMGGMSRRA